MHALGADGVHRDGERERRVDAAGEPHDDAGKVMLHDIVAHAQDERAIHALLIGKLGGDGGGLRCRAAVRIAREFHQMSALDKGRRARHQHAVRIHAE